MPIDTDSNGNEMPSAVSVRAPVMKLREAQMQSSVLHNMATLDYQSRKCAPKSSCCLPPAQQPVNQKFFMLQKDARAPYRGEALPVPGAEGVDATPSNHSANVVQFMKTSAATSAPALSQHIKPSSGCNKSLSDLATDAQQMQARE